jgi:hypothetical protein
MTSKGTVLIVEDNGLEPKSVPKITRKSGLNSLARQAICGGEGMRGCLS